MFQWQCNSGSEPGVYFRSPKNVRSDQKNAQSRRHSAEQTLYESPVKDPTPKCNAGQLGYKLVCISFIFLLKKAAPLSSCKLCISNFTVGLQTDFYYQYIHIQTLVERPFDIFGWTLSTSSPSSRVDKSGSTRPPTPISNFKGNDRVSLGGGEGGWLDPTPLFACTSEGV